MATLGKVYIIIQGQGEYSDRITWPAKVYRDKAMAEAAMTKLEAIYNKCDHEVGGYVLNNKIKPQIEAEYAALGFDDAGPYDDWELAEAELVE